MKQRFLDGRFNPKDISPFTKGHKSYTPEHISEEQKKKIGLGNKGKIHTKEQTENYKKWRKTWIFPMRDTKIEEKIQNFLKQLHIEYLTHNYISDITHAYQCDILIPSAKTIIECDGCFFHACPICKLKEYKWTKERRELDKLRTEELISKGYKVIRLWEHEIKKMEVADFKSLLD